MALLSLAMAFVASACSDPVGLRGKYNLKHARVTIDGFSFRLDDMVGEDIVMSLMFHSRSIVSLNDDRGNDAAIGRYALDGGHLTIALDGRRDTLRFGVKRMEKDTLVLVNVLPERMLIDYIAFPKTDREMVGMDHQIHDGPLGAYTSTWHNMIDPKGDTVMEDSAATVMARRKMESLRQAIMTTHRESAAGKRQPITAFSQVEDSGASAELTLTLVLERRHVRHKKKVELYF